MAKPGGDVLSAVRRAVEERPFLWSAVGLGIVSFAIRFYALSHPNSVVFDEYHFGAFTNAYHKGGWRNKM